MTELVNGVSCTLPDSRSSSDSLRENCLIVDWFSLSVKFDFQLAAENLCIRYAHNLSDDYINNPDDSLVEEVSLSFAKDFIENILMLEDPFITWLDMSGFYGFHKRLYFNGISVHYAGNLSKGLHDRIFIEMSGSGCRSYDEWGLNSWACLFSLATTQPAIYHCSRLDVAYDDYDGVLDIHLLDEFNVVHNLTTRFRDYRLEKSYVTDDMCIYYGSMSSDIMFRCYNKAAERGRSEDIPHWIRFEIQLRDDRAYAFIASYLDTGDFGGIYSGIIDKQLRYVIPTGSDTNKARWDSPAWWTNFIGKTAAIRDFTKKNTEYNLMKLENYVTSTSCAAINTYIECVGFKKFVNEVKRNMKKKNKLPIKYEKIKQSVKLADDLWSSAKDLSEAFQLLEGAGLI